MRISALFVLAVASAGCRHPNLGDEYGQATRAALERQTRGGAPAGPLDGKDAQNVMTAHHAQTPAGQTSPAPTQSGTQGGPILLTPAQ